MRETITHNSRSLSDSGLWSIFVILIQVLVQGKVYIQFCKTLTTVSVAEQALIEFNLIAKHVLVMALKPHLLLTSLTQKPPWCSG